MTPWTILEYFVPALAIVCVACFGGVILFFAGLGLAGALMDRLSGDGEEGL